MGLAESTQHVPNPLLGWRSRIQATCTHNDHIINATSWKMNSLVVLPKPPYTIFASHGPSVYCYVRSKDNETLILKDTITPGTSEEDFINQMRMLNVAGLSRLVAVYDSGLICLWDPENMSQAPLKLHNDMDSTWSLASSSVSPVLFVGSNRHNVCSFHLSSHHIQTTRDVVLEHDHNIPCIDISPCGRFLASASIDSTVRIIHINTKTQLGKVRLAQWGWCCLWIPKDQVACFSSPDRISWLTTIFSKDARTPSLENVDTRHYELVKEDTSMPEAPPAKKRVVNMEGVSIDNFENIELIDEMEEDDQSIEEDGEGEMEIEAEENGFAEAEEEEDEEVGRPQYGLIGDMPDQRNDNESEEVVNPFLDMPPGGKVEQSKKTQSDDTHVPDDCLLFVATFDEMYLFDAHLKMLCRTTKPLPKPAEDSTLLNMVERFLISLWIPEWSMVIAANQGLGSVIISTVRFNTITCQYELIPELSLPRFEDRVEHEHYILSGVSCYRVNEEEEEDEKAESSASEGEKMEVTQHADSSSPLPSNRLNIPKKQRKFFYRLHLSAGNLITYDLRMRDDGKVVAKSLN